MSTQTPAEIRQTFAHLPVAAQDNLVELFTATSFVVSDRYGYRSIEVGTLAELRPLAAVGNFNIVGPATNVTDTQQLLRHNCDVALTLTSHHRCYCGCH